MNSDAHPDPVKQHDAVKSPMEPGSEIAGPETGEGRMSMDWLAKGKRRVLPDGRSNFEYPHELKVEVILEVFKGNARQSEISERYGVPQPLISLWRKAAIEGIVNSLHGKKRGRPPARSGFALVDDLSEAEALVLRLGATLKENTELLENSLRLLLGRGSNHEIKSGEQGNP